MRRIKKILLLLLKLPHDFMLIFYDDLEFQAMSLPRLAAGLFVGMIGAVVIEWLRTGRMFPEFATLCAASGAVWGAYSFNKYLKRKEDEQPHDKLDN